MGVQEMRKVRTMSAERIYSNLFGSCITGRRYIPGREASDEMQGRRREADDFRVIDDYIEQA